MGLASSPRMTKWLVGAVGAVLLLIGAASDTPLDSPPVAEMHAAPRASPVESVDHVKQRLAEDPPQPTYISRCRG